MKVGGTTDADFENYPAQIVRRNYGDNVERLTGAIISGALVIGGATMIDTPESGWHHLLGELLVSAGVFGAVIITIGAVRRDRGRR
jgi:hypothetical protein